jgi:hypothetical protein
MLSEAGRRIDVLEWPAIAADRAGKFGLFEIAKQENGENNPVLYSAKIVTEIHVCLHLPMAGIFSGGAHGVFR